MQCQPGQCLMIQPWQRRRQLAGACTYLMVRFTSTLIQHDRWPTEVVTIPAVLGNQLRAMLDTIAQQIKGECPHTANNYLDDEAPPQIEVGLLHMLLQLQSEFQERNSESLQHAAQAPIDLPAAEALIRRAEHVIQQHFAQHSTSLALPKLVIVQPRICRVCVVNSALVAYLNSSLNSACSAREIFYYTSSTPSNQSPATLATKQPATLAKSLNDTTA